GHIHSPKQIKPLPLFNKSTPSKKIVNSNPEDHPHSPRNVRDPSSNNERPRTVTGVLMAAQQTKKRNSSG
ncbi:Hypothetical protein FKW44_013276, partial [Caligus rogercresseyi]